MMRSALLLSALLALAGTAAADQVSSTTTRVTVTGDDAKVTQETKSFSHPAVPSFEEADADRDGTLSRQEARDVGLLEFDVADVNKDGWLNREEYDASP